jgi:hypothetical protein
VQQSKLAHETVSVHARIVELLLVSQTRRHVDGGKGAGMEDAAVRAMREENDALIDDLEGKVEQVSRAAGSINTEVRTSMDLLRSVVSSNCLRDIMRLLLLRARSETTKHALL